jgi:hypothetical protein
MAIDRDTSRRGVGWIKFILAALVVFVVAIPLLMGIAGLSNQGGETLDGGDGTAPAQTGSTATDEAR